jgi:hypothetical protein
MQTRLAGVIGLLILTALGSAIAALVLPSGIPAAAPAQTRITLGAFDVVSPSVVDVVFAKPQAPAHANASRPAQALVPTRTTHVRHAETVASPLCSGDGWQQRRGEAALASLRTGPASGVSIAFLAGRGALKGMTYYDSHRVDVYVGSCSSESDALLRHVVAHELGHAWDSLHMTDALRADYLAARGIPAGTSWFGCNACQDFATPAGDFAETYAQWQRSASDSRSELAAPASPAQLTDLGARFFS